MSVSAEKILATVFFYFKGILLIFSMNIVLWTSHTTTNFLDEIKLNGKNTNFEYETLCLTLYNCSNPTKNWEFVLDYTGTSSGLIVLQLYLFGSLKEILGGQRFDDEAFVCNRLVLKSPLFYDNGIKNCLSLGKMCF